VLRFEVACTVPDRGGPACPHLRPPPPRRRPRCQVTPGKLRQTSSMAAPLTIRPTTSCAPIRVPSMIVRPAHARYARQVLVGNRWHVRDHGRTGALRNSGDFDGPARAGRVARRRLRAPRRLSAGFTGTRLQQFHGTGDRSRSSTPKQVPPLAGARRRPPAARPERNKGWRRGAVAHRTQHRSRRALFDEQVDVAQ